jgi:hypothetical protein
MIFTLEVMQAAEGDCLLLHFGTNEKPSFIVIDGGPSGVFGRSLEPRLIDIKDKISPLQPLSLSMVMVSHLDDDHVNGILDLTREAQKDNPKFKIDNLWFNTFDDILGNSQIESVVAGGVASVSSLNIGGIKHQLDHINEHLSAVISSTGQGRTLRNDAIALHTLVNNPFKAMSATKPNLVVCDETDLTKNIIGWHGLNITVLHPNKQRLLELQAQWDKDLVKIKAGTSTVAAASIIKDNSAFNLSSIVCLVKSNSKTILLTGDGRDDDIMAGLKINNLLDAHGKCHVDILKVPHHGSERNSSVEFYKRITADHYVISANGKHKNPDKGMLDMFAEGTKGRDNFTLHLTNHEGRDKEFELKPVLDAFIATERAKGRTFKVEFREPSSSSMVLNLLDAITH